MTPHLTHNQLCDLLLASPLQQNDVSASEAQVSEIQDHLRGCYACSAELATLTTSLSGYRETAHAVAQRDFTPLPRTAPAPLLAHHSLLHPVYWAIAATALVVALLPFTTPRHPSIVQPQPTRAVAAPVAGGAESDAALLEDINKDLSASIPPSMQPLADPIPSSASNTDNSTTKD
jgi:hypothetical protein